MKIAVIGTGYVGLVVGAGLSETGNDVTCADVDQRKIDGLKENILPIYEPGLDALVERNQRQGRLHFTTDVASAVSKSEVIIIAVGTPPDEDGSADVRLVLNVAETIGEHMSREVVVVTKSTVPVGTAAKVAAAVSKRARHPFHMEETERLHKLGYPVLVGTVSVDVSETLSRMFKRAGIVHNVLNAKYHQREAEIVAGAGQPAGVTIATNMAGRGTDIKLGPGVTEAKPSQRKNADNELEDVIEDGGLHIIGSERHESRRIDRQLRGRSGRQGDPGASQFFLSLEDDLMRLFGSERIAKLMDRMGAQEGEVLTHALITRSIGQAQKRVELQNFQSRKRLLDFDDVMNQQREVIYSLRSFALEGGEELKGEALKMVDKALTKRVDDRLGDLESEEAC